MRNVNLERWRGRRDAAGLEPAELEFIAVKRTSCAGCAFEFQYAAVCGKAHHEAVKRSLPPCEAGVVYRIVERDPRQLEIG